MKLNEEQLAEAIEQYKERKVEAERVETAAEELAGDEAEPGMLKKWWTWYVAKLNEVMTSKHFDLFKTTLISMVLATLSYQLPNIYFWAFGKENINASFAEMIQQHSFAAFGFFVARLVVDVSLYFNENKFYAFIKRNGNIAFDYQENLMELNKWQQSLISTIKYCIYLYVYVSLLKQ